MLALIRMDPEPSNTPPAVTAAAPAATPPVDQVWGAQPRPEDTDTQPAATARPILPVWQQPVPYTSDGLIDWGRLEDELPTPVSDDEFECEIAELDFSKPLSSNLHPYYHGHPNSDCQITGHKCMCDKCRVVVDVPVASPVRKRSKGSAETATFVEASPIPMEEIPCPVETNRPGFSWDAQADADFDDEVEVVEERPPVATTTVTETVESGTLMDLRVPGSPRPMGIAVSENLLGQIETLADTATIPDTAANEKAASTKTKCAPRRRFSKKPAATGGFL